MKRRTFIKNSLAAGATAAVPGFLTRLAAQPLQTVPASAASATLPWQREIPLREAAQSVVVENTLSRANPLPDSGGFGGGGAMTINNLKMRTTMWGTPDRITISLNKNNVWDRRVTPHAFKVTTLQEITDGAFSPANADAIGINPNGVNLRPKSYGYLRKEGGSYDPWRQPMEYAFPCMKPVGQIILGMDALAGAVAPAVTQSCANGVVKLQVVKGDAKASLEYVLGMANNIYAIRGTFAGMTAPIWLRLYRHRDTSHLVYMREDGTFTPQAIQRGIDKDKEFNFPMDPPTSGQDGDYFWIRQKFPAEKTFPQGFECVLMGILIAPKPSELKVVEGQTGLGTKPPDARIAAAPGAAATATITPGAGGTLEALVAVVTTMDVTDGTDVVAVAKKRLAEAKTGGFDGIARQNGQWWNAFYDKRENGRVFHGDTGRNCSDNIRSSIYRSYAESHGGGTKTDMRQFECTASYGLPEKDVQNWNSEPCYNEVFTTNRYVRNWADSEDMWKQLVWHWMPGAKQNARDMFNMPGMCIVHGYLPPIKSDVYLHTTLTLEFCLGTMAEIIKPVWDEWDYSGDIKVLRDECYPLMREMALFYAAYAKKGDDGYYHVIPSMEEERWGWYPKFARNKDVTSSVCMFRWALNKAADAAELLGLDADQRGHWREVAAQLLPYATWKMADGLLEYAGQPGVEPTRLPDDHFGEPAMYPALLADEINLDSPKEQKDMMLRTLQTLRAAGTASETTLLLGVAADATTGRRRTSDDSEALCNSRSGRIHLFPVSPAGEVVAFRNFQARGGFLVSACKNAGGVSHVEIQSRRDNPCQIMNPWPGKTVVVREAGQTAPVPFKLDMSNGECVVVAAPAGHTYTLEQAAA